MNSDDVFFGGMTFVCAVVIIGLLSILGLDCRNRLTGANQKTVEITDTFKLPPELAGCRVFCMTPAGFGRSLYVVTRGDEPKAVVWETQQGKSGKRMDAVLLEDGK